MAVQRHSVDITSSTILRTVFILVGFWFLYLIADVLLLLFAAIVIAAAIEPVAKFFQRYRVPRAGSVVLVYALLLLVFAGVVTAMVPPLTAQVTQLAQQLPQLIAFVEHFDLISAGEGEEITQSLQRALFQLGNSLANASFDIFRSTATVFSSIFSFLFIFVLAFYLVIEEDALLKFFRLVTPREHQPYIERMVQRALKSVGRWVLAQLTLGVIVGVVVGVGLWLIGIPYALVLGLLAGLFEIIPVIGPIIAAIPGVLVGVSQSLLLGGITLAFYILVQQFENHVLVPNIMKRAVGLNPLVTIVAVLLGARLGGIPGAIFAVPMATILSIFLSDFFADDSDELLAG